MSINVGTVLVLIGTILFALALLFSQRGEPRGRYYATNFLLSLGGTLIGLGILLGAAPLHTIH